MIIHDFLDNDLYKFTVMNAIQKKFPDSEVVYRFVNRGNTSFPPGFADALNPLFMKTIKIPTSQNEPPSGRPSRKLE